MHIPHLDIFVYARTQKPLVICPAKARYLPLMPTRNFSDVRLPTSIMKNNILIVGSGYSTMEVIARAQRKTHLHPSLHSRYL
jgi:hypothetical protein